MKPAAQHFLELEHLVRQAHELALDGVFAAPPPVEGFLDSITPEDQREDERATAAILWHLRNALRLAERRRDAARTVRSSDSWLDDFTMAPTQPGR